MCLIIFCSLCLFVYVCVFHVCLFCSYLFVCLFVCLFVFRHFKIQKHPTIFDLFSFRENNKFYELSNLIIHHFTNKEMFVCFSFMFVFFIHVCFFTSNISIFANFNSKAASLINCFLISFFFFFHFFRIFNHVCLFIHVCFYLQHFNICQFQF